MKRLGVLALLLVAFGLGMAAQKARSPRERRTQPVAVPPENLPLFLLAGQSNMSGRAPVTDPAPLPGVFCFGNDYHWHAAQEPLDTDAGQVDLVSDDPQAAAGPGLPFARALGFPLALLPCAKGGSSIREWERNLQDTRLYGALLKRARAASPMGPFAGLLFFQGETDAERGDRAPEEWAARFSRFVTDLRRDLDAPALPVVFAQIGPCPDAALYRSWQTVQEQQASVRLPHCAMIRTDDLPTQPGNADRRVHFTAAGYAEIGMRFAGAWRSLTRTAPPAPPE